MTRDEIIDSIFDRLSISTGATARVTLARADLNRDYLRVCAAHKLTWNTGTLAFTADDPFVDLPDDWMSTETIRVGSTILEPVTPQRLTELEAAATSGVERHFALWPPDRIRLGWTPDEDDNAAATIHYLYRPTLMSGSTDEPTAIPTEFHDVLVEMGVIRLGQRDEEQAITAEARANLALLEAEMREMLPHRAGQSSHRVIRAVYG